VSATAAVHAVHSVSADRVEAAHVH
jgi:hypothetical protein